VMLKSFEKRRRVLEEQFRETAGNVGTDACSYRFFSDSVRPTVAPLCSALSDFQSLYWIVYDAIKTGPKARNRKLPPDVLEEASFFVGYTFPGSVGIVLTFDNDMRGRFETALDAAMQSLFELAKARSSTAIIDCGRRLGVQAVKAAHKWASAHVDAALGADIEWLKGHEAIDRLFMQLPDLRELASVIASTTTVIEEDLELVGRLSGADVDKRTFHLALPGSADIRGKLSDGVPTDRIFEVGAEHKVTLRKRVRVYYSTDQEEDASYSLLFASVVQKEKQHGPTESATASVQ
jgi:hypothetical protein